jgi:DNA-binding LacI/PurR family transcriptional regulator
MSPEAKHIPVLRIFKSCNIPVVCTFPAFSSAEFNTVALDYYHCGYTVAKYLLDNHHRKILYINRNPVDAETLKKAGAMAAFAERKVKWQEQLWNCNPDGFTDAEVKKIIENQHCFSAVSCHEIHFNHVKRELTHRNDVQIIHNIFGKSEAAREEMPVIIQPVAKAAILAVDMLLEAINSPESAKQTRQILLKSTIYEPEIFKSTQKRKALK